MQYRNGKRYFTMSQYCEQRFGGRIAKIPLSYGCSCPNRDGSRGVGGCTFCRCEQLVPPLGGGFLPSLAEQYQSGCARLLSKWEGARPVGYFQDFSNTHLPLEQLSQLLDEAVALPDVVGIRLATRADCIDADKVALLSAVQQRTGLPIEIELGLQTAHDQTAALINRCHSFSEFVAGHRMLRQAGLYTCVHLINGLPNESAEMMRQSAARLAALRPGGIKLHMLHLIFETPLAVQYEKEPFVLLTREQYAEIICDQLEQFSPDTVVERLTGDGAADWLIAPQWCKNKRAVLNLIDQRLAKRDTRQGARWQEGNP